ncbi:MAG: hypothetical protein KBD51_00830 [Candidatus Levybacteria bacterium]|nr:hypothetical protein [Candidatus Levybacteria bacterium]
MKIKKFLIFSFTSILLLFLLIIFSIYLILFLEVRKVCNNAILEYKTNCRESLIKTFQSNNSTIKEKNDAIWTLGQLADKKSLPFLNSIYKEDMPDREPLDKVISQYEIRKAIKWSEKGNWTSWMYFKYN